MNEKEIINKLINILDCYDNGTEIISNQGQPLDGYSALYNFVDLARKAKATQQAVSIVLKFKIRNSWPCSVEENTEDNKIFEKKIEESEIYVEDGVRYYDMLCGHGTHIKLPVI